MLDGCHPVLQALLGTLFTWGLTAAGAALVFVFQSGQRRILDGSLGFAAGVMLAASYWSLLDPAVEMATLSGFYGSKGQWAFFPVTVGFLLGAIFVYMADLLILHLGKGSMSAFLTVDRDKLMKEEVGLSQVVEQEALADSSGLVGSMFPTMQRRRQVANLNPSDYYCNSSTLVPPSAESALPFSNNSSWKRIMLLIIAITIHNIPEGLAVGVGFGAIGKTPSATFESARNLALGIGIQNFPEGLAVSLPLRGTGLSPMKSFWFGQLSGMVEPISGLFGAVAVSVAEPFLPYALSFAAGAMIYVVVDDIVPEANSCGNGKLASWGALLGFALMMSLDVGLG